MSATIVHRSQGERPRSSSPRQPAHHQDSSASRLLGRAQYHTNFSSLTNSAPEQFTRVQNNTGSNEEDNGRPRSSTPCLDYDVLSNTFVVSTETEDDIRRPLVCHENRVGNGQLNHKITGLTANHVGQKETSYLADILPSKVVDPDYTPTGRNIRDVMAQKSFYTTSTQKLYQGVNWPRRIIPSPPQTSIEHGADMVAFRNEAKRYELHSEIWQKFGSRPFSWDYVQTRDGHHIPGPIRFCSPSKSILHIPGYMGHVTGGPGEMDNPGSFFDPQSRLRTSQPRYSDTARKANIPGYAGCVLYCDYQPASSNDPDHLRSTASRTYRPHDEVLCNSRSPFKKTSSISRMVTLTHPFNPFNKVH